MTPEPITADELATRASTVHELYRRCFAEPPWNEPAEQLARYPEDFARFLAKPGISAMAVWNGQSLAGLIYGWPSPAEFPHDPFHSALTAAVSTVDPLLAPSFDVVELMVDPAYRGQGIGKALLTEFVHGHDTAWLVTHPDAPARGLYERAGWQPFGEFTNHLGDPRLIYTWSRGPADVQAGRLAEDQSVRGGRAVQAEAGKVEQPA